MGSGSTGNAVLVRSSRSLLIDCGFSPRALHRRIADVPGPRPDIAGIVVTHEHGDHARGAPALAQDLGIPILGTRGTLAALPGDGYETRPLPESTPSSFAGFRLRLFPVDHDAAQPAGVRIDDEDGSFGFLTDAGRITPAIVGALRGCRNLIVESNHDPDLLRHGPYPEPLKRRIAGSRGHLSNDACGALLSRVVTAATRRVVLHHLSRFNNTPGLALASAHARLHRAGLTPPGLAAARPDVPTGPFAW